MIGATVLHIARGELSAAMTTAILLVYGHIRRLYALEGEADCAANRCVTFRALHSWGAMTAEIAGYAFVLPWEVRLRTH